MIDDQLIGLVVILLCAGFMTFYMLVDRKKGSRVVFREIPAFKRLQQSIGLTVEEGETPACFSGKRQYPQPG